jgi:hypothetical protein
MHAESKRLTWPSQLSAAPPSLAVIGLALVVSWNTLLGFVFSPSGVFDGSSLPARLHVCGRSWNKGGPETLEAIVADYSPGPTLVSPVLGGLLSPCPATACTDIALNTPCDTVVFVRISEDAYVGYSLSGGP